MANTENIEARLCAYVDGELDAAGRAEIEAHLDANPQHRQLIRDLIDQRALLRELPRSSAPEDLLESVQTTLERSVLLNGDGEGGRDAHIAGRINPWPRFFGIAAVLVLGLGLVAVIFLMLPKPNDGNLVLIHTPATAPSDASTAGELPSDFGPADTTSRAGGLAGTLDTEAGGAGREDRAAAVPEPGDLSTGRPNPEPDLDASIAAKMPGHVPATSPAEDPEAPANDGGVDIFAKGGPIQGKAGDASPSPYANIFQNAAGGGIALKSEIVDDKLRQTGAITDKSMLVVVSAENPSVANSRVQSYLSSNNIRWEDVTEPMPPPLPLQESQVMTASRAQAYDVRMKQAPASASPEREMRDAAAQQAEAAQQQRPAEAQQQAMPPAGASGTPELKDNIAKSAAAPAEQHEAADALSSAGRNRDVRRRADEQERSAASLGVQTQDAARSREPLAPATTLPQAMQREQIQPTEPAPAPVPPPAPTGDLGARQQQAPSTSPAAGDERPPVPQQQFIVARGLTPKQFDELNASISQESPGRVSAYFRAGDGQYTPTTLPSFVSADIAGGAPAAPAAPAAVAANLGTTQPSNVDQQTQLGAEPPAPAATTAPSAVATPTAVAASQPAATSQPVPAAVQAPAPSTTAPKEELRQLHAAAPSTAPAAGSAATNTSAAATQPAAGDRLDVVIVLQSEAAESFPPAQRAVQSAAPRSDPAAAVTEPAGQATTQPVPATIPTSAPATAPAAQSAATQPATAPVAE